LSKKLKWCGFLAFTLDKVGQRDPMFDTVFVGRVWVT